MCYKNFGIGILYGHGISNILLFVIGVIIFIAVIYIITGRKNIVRMDSFSEKNGAINDFSPLVLSMLTQYGGGLSQIEISSRLGLSAQITGAKLLEMEKEGLIIRQWDNDKYTFIVRKSS